MGELIAAAGVFVGRESELAALLGGLEDALAGRGRLFLISGEPGIGKSRLADELANRATEQGAKVLVGRCWEVGGAPAFWPWVQALRVPVREHDAPALRSELGAGASALARILPELRERFPDLPDPPSLEAEGTRFRLFDAVMSFLRNAAQEQPIVLVLDDLHAADEPSLVLLRFVARELGTSRLLVVGAYRDVDPTVANPLATTVAELSREPVTRTLSLTGMDELDVARFIELSTAYTPSASLVETVHAEAEGNPLFVGEIVRLLATEGRLDDPGGPRLPIPPTVNQVIGRRLRHLSRECYRVLTLASVLGREFDLEPLARVSGHDRKSLLELLDEAIAARIVSRVPGTESRLRFAHGLMQDSLYGELSPDRRVSMHGEIGRTLEQVYALHLEPHLAELSHHFLHALTDDRRKALGYARRAADRAMAQLAYEEATRLYSLALEALDLQEVGSLPVRCELLLSLGEAQEAAGAAAESKETFIRAADVARSAGSHEHLARAALGYGGRLTWLRPAAGDTRLVPLLEEALEALGHGDTTLRAMLLARLASALRYDRSSERREALSREAVAMARRLDDPLTLFYVLIGRRMIAWAPENIDEHLEIASEIVRLADAAGDPERRADARLMRSDGYLIRGDIHGVRADLDAAVRLSAEARRATAAWHLLVHQAFLALLEGRFAEAETLTAEMARVGEQVKAPDAAGSAVTQTFALRWGLGGLDEIEGEIAQMALERPTRPFFRCLLAVADLELGNDERARRTLQDLAADDFACIPRDKEWMLALALLVEVATALGDVDRTAVLYRLLEPYGNLVAVNAHDVSTGAAARTLGIAATALRRFDAAEGHFRDALAINERIGARPWLARTQFDYARMLLARREPGDVEAAAELLQTALTTCRELAMEPLATSVTGLLSELGVREGGAESFAGHRIEGVLGRGGMSVVYRAHDPRLKRSVALKLMAPELASDTRFRDRFLKESELAASLEHPNVVPIYDAGEVEGQLFLVMRLVEGRDLKALLREEGPLEPEAALAISSQVAEALDAAHARGLVHRDVKPSNVLLDEHGHAYLADFGLTRRLSDQAAGFEAGLSLGTPAYVAPEQIEGKDVDGRADQYSLACLLHECLTGAPPFPRSSEAAVLYAHLEEQPPATPGLEQVMARALAKAPSDRYPTCTELVADAGEGLGIAVQRRARWPLAIAALGVAVIAAALLAFFLTRGSGGPSTTGRVVRLDAATGKVVSSVPVGNDPEAIAAGPDGVWVANFTDGTVSKIDPDGLRVSTIRVNGLPVSLAVGGGVVLVATAPPANTLTLIRAQAGSVYDLIPLHAAAAAATSLVEAGPAGIWLADKEQWTVRRVDPAGGTDFRVLAANTLRLRNGVAEVNGLAVGKNAVWVAGNYLDRRLWRLDPRTARVVATIPLPIAPRRVAVGEGAVWITGEIENAVLRVDPRENRVVARIPVGRGGSAIAAAGGSVWVANQVDGTVTRIDPRGNRVTATIRVGGSPHDLVVFGGVVWVAGSRE